MVDPRVVDDWTQRLPTITASYDLKDVFNAHETGLYFCALPQRSMTHASEDGKGVKVSKERLTVLVACSATGEKLPLLMIGKAANPHCFRGYKKAAPGIRWEHNKGLDDVDDLPPVAWAAQQLDGASGKSHPPVHRQLYCPPWYPTQQRPHPVPA